MLKEKSHNLLVTLLMLCCCLFLYACQTNANGSGDEPEPPEETERLPLTQIDLPYESFQKVVGWISDDTLLVHVGDTENHELLSYNIFTGEQESIYIDDTSILSVELNKTRTKILIQEVSQTLSRLKVIDTDGSTVQSIDFDYSSYVTLDWNPTDDNTVFVSHYSYDHIEESENIEVYIWTIDENTLNPKDIPSISPQWYSANVYLYIDEINSNALYIGDIREDQDDMMLNRDIASFYLNEDTFLGIIESDIQDNVLHLFHEYPFLVGDKVISVPKVTMNDYPVKPHLTQSTRNGKIYGVIPQTSFALEEELGEYSLSYLDFENEETEEVMPLPEDAPVALSPSEEYILYGWRLEYIADLEEGELFPLLEVLN